MNDRRYPARPRRPSKAQEPPEGRPEDDWDLTGLCSEAQADGVPCFELGRHCETCERAAPLLRLKGTTEKKP